VIETEPNIPEGFHIATCDTNPEMRSHPGPLALCHLCSPPRKEDNDLEMGARSRHD